MDSSRELDSTTVSTHDEKADGDIEIIEESFTTGVEVTSALQSSHISDNLKSHLAKSYNTSQIAIAAKPQSNFISNLNCIDQILEESDFYNKLKRRKPYSNVKLRAIYDESEEDDESDSTGLKVKKKQVIIIDDTNEEMHKPWITPELIKLIKHRNMLQSKINQSLNKKPEDANPTDLQLIDKFKNLRNKVTKLVKKARSNFSNRTLNKTRDFLLQIKVNIFHACTYLIY